MPNPRPTTNENIVASIWVLPILSVDNRYNPKADTGGPATNQTLYPVRLSRNPLTITVSIRPSIRGMRVSPLFVGLMPMTACRNIGKKDITPNRPTPTIIRPTPLSVKMGSLNR